MKTESQLRAEFYNAIANNTNVTDLVDSRIYWISRITVENTFPLITYAKFDTSGDYSFGLNLSSESVIFETRIYTNNINIMDTLYEEIKQSLLAAGYMNMNAPAEFLEKDINKNVRIARWEKINT